MAWMLSVLECWGAEKSKSSGEFDGERKWNGSRWGWRRSLDKALVCLLPGGLALLASQTLCGSGICFWKPLGELLLKRGQLFFCGDISPLVWVFPQIVKLL